MHLLPSSTASSSILKNMVTSHSGQVYDDEERSLMIPTFLLQAAYDRLDEILKDYIK